MFTDLSSRLPLSRLDICVYSSKSYHELQTQVNTTSHTIVMVSQISALSGSGQGNCLDLLWTSEVKLGPQEFKKHSEMRGVERTLKEPYLFFMCIIYLLRK